MDFTIWQTKWKYFLAFYSFNISDLTRNGQSTGAVDIVGAVDIQDNIPKFSFSGDANKLFTTRLGVKYKIQR